jgi:hypothetical protein
MAQAKETVMATWIRCTRAQEHDAVLLNIDLAVSIAKAKEGGSIIGFAGHSLHVNEDIRDIIKLAGIRHTWMDDK